MGDADFQKAQWISQTEKRQLRLDAMFICLLVWEEPEEKSRFGTSLHQSKAEAEAELEKWAAEEKLLEKGYTLLEIMLKIKK